ncbi:MAG: hypothetical protein RL155_243, partial [Actinomycetota bacterium]
LADKTVRITWPINMSELVLATRNAGKIAEVQRLISVHAPHIKLRSVAEFNLDDVEETGVTFEENALLKATTIARHTGLPALRQVFIRRDGQACMAMTPQILQKFYWNLRMCLRTNEAPNSYALSLSRVQMENR